MKTDYFKVHSVFESISGEVSNFPQGSRTLFIRLAGCNLRCPWCDTPESLITDSALDYSVTMLLDQIYSSGIDNILITGGEPLLQSDLLVDLCQEIETKYWGLEEPPKKIAIETNGTIPIPKKLLKMENITIIMDWKFLDNYSPIESHYYSLREIDFIKFVITNKMDLMRATCIQALLTHELTHPPIFAYSPMIKDTDTPDSIQSNILIKEIIATWKAVGINGVLNIQMHKFLNLP